ncbi:hypothetical protein JCM6882_006166 [Rhodosporidiobolus microsporus]
MPAQTTPRSTTHTPVARSSQSSSSVRRSSRLANPTPVLDDFVPAPTVVLIEPPPISPSPVTVSRKRSRNEEDGDLPSSTDEVDSLATEEPGRPAKRRVVLEASEAVTLPGAVEPAVETTLPLSTKTAETSSVAATTATTATLSASKSTLPGSTTPPAQLQGASPPPSTFSGRMTTRSSRKRRSEDLEPEKSVDEQASPSAGRTDLAGTSPALLNVPQAASVSPPSRISEPVPASALSLPPSTRVPDLSFPSNFPTDAGALFELAHIACSLTSGSSASTTGLPPPLHKVLLPAPYIFPPPLSLMMPPRSVPRNLVGCAGELPFELANLHRRFQQRY